MTYADSAALSEDQQFKDRLGASLNIESLGKPDDPLANRILGTTVGGWGMFMPFVSSAPGFGDKYAAGGQESITDGDLLSAVQASWARVAAIHTPSNG